MANTINTIKKMLDAKPTAYKETVEPHSGEWTDSPVIILPPKANETNPEAEHYPQDYVDYCLARAREYKQKTGENPLSPSSWKTKPE